MAHGTHRERAANGGAWEKRQRTSPTKLSPGSILQSLQFTSSLSSPSAFTLHVRNALRPTIFLPAAMSDGLPLERRCSFRTSLPNTLLGWLVPAPVRGWRLARLNGSPV